MTEEQRLTAEDLQAIGERADKATEILPAENYQHYVLAMQIVKEDIPRLLSHISAQARVIALAKALADSCEVLAITNVDGIEMDSEDMFDHAALYRLQDALREKEATQ